MRRVQAVFIAAQLRPRAGAAGRWQAGQKALQMGQRQRLQGLLAGIGQAAGKGDKKVHVGRIIPV